MGLIAVCLVLIGIPGPVWASAAPRSLGPGVHLRFDRFSTDEGLSQNAALALLQDRRGFLWVGTQDGLDRYDGHQFVSFRNDPADPHSLGLNSVIALFEDAEGFLWVGTWGGGLDRYDPATGWFTHFPSDPSRPESLANPVVTDIYQDREGTIWVATLGGLDRFVPGSGTFVHHRHDPNSPQSLGSDAISMVRPGPDGQLWVGTGAFNVPGNGLNLFDPATGRSQRFLADGKGLGGPNVADLATDAQGRVWVALGGYGVPGRGLDCYDPRKDTWTHVDIGLTGNQYHDNNITSLAFDREGRLWITSWIDGLWVLSPRGDLAHLGHDPLDPESPSSDSSFSVFEDRSGVLWVGTLNAGVIKADLDNLKVQTFRNEASDPKSLQGNHVSSFAQTPDGTVWVGTWDDGLARFDPVTGTFAREKYRPGQPGSLSSNLISTLWADADGSLWVGTMGAGLNHLDPATGQNRIYRANPKVPGGLLEDQVLAVFQDPTGRLWVSTFAGLSRLDPGAQGFVNYPLPAPATCFAMVGRELWMGTWGGGVKRLDLGQPANLAPSTAVFTTMVHEEGKPGTLSRNGVWSILPVPGGSVWLGTEGGLDRWDPATGTVKSYTVKDGLRNDTILGLVQDEGGDLWAMTNNGLVRFDLHKGSHRTYDRFDGLQGNEFSSGALLKGKDGRLYFGGLRGFSTFDPQVFAPSPPPPPVAITGFSVFNIPQRINLDGSQAVTLNYEQNFFSFEFAALDFHNPPENRFAYKLEGFDRDWVQTGSRSYASYTNLPGGTYTFRVKAATRNGAWNDPGMRLSLTIIPPFWQTWPFQIAVVLGTGILVWLGVRWRLRSVRRQNSQLQVLLDEQQKVEGDLRRSEARFKAIFDNSAIGIGLMSLDGVILDTNPAMSAILGYGREELIGQRPTRFAFPEEVDSSVQQFRPVFSGEVSHLLAERRLVHRDGRVFWTLISLNVVRGPQGEPLYVVELVSDIDEQKRSSERLAAQELDHRRQLESRIAERTEELNQANKQLREKATQEAVIAERTRLARELHDAVTQTLFSASLIAEVIPEIWDTKPAEGRQRLDQVRQLTRGALAEMRTLLVELRPNALLDVPLPALFRQLTEALAGRSKTSILLDAVGDRNLPADIQIGLYRLGQEALNNVIKHAKATQAIVTLRLGDDVRLTITDNGVGFDRSRVTADHLGLKIMRERAESIGASLSIESQPGEGTRIAVSWTTEGSDPKESTHVDPNHDR